jgi:hypothetical protein
MAIREHRATPAAAGRPGLLSAGARRAAPALGSAAVLAGVVVWMFSRQLFDHWTFPWDFLGTYSTTPAFVAATVGHLHPLTWSPFVASGFPVDVDAQAGFYFPGWWVLGAINVPATLRVLTAVQVAHVLFAGAGALALGRARSMRWSWALLAGVAYVMFGGFYGQAEHADIFRGFAYLPWLLWALTPPAQDRSWSRLALLPPLAWLIASGAYPGELVSFALMGLAYLLVALRAQGPGAWRRHRVPLALSVVASAATCAVVLLPYLRAEQAGELYRTVEPTAAVRAAWAFSPTDVLGLYLNNFSWTADGTVTAWAVGVPVLVGLALVRMATLRRQAPLVACGVLGLLLAFTPKIGPIGTVMADLRPLFPSRFPASDYKAGIALALIILSIDAWSRSALGLRARALSVGVAACLLVAGVLVAPTPHAPLSRALWLVLLVLALACLAALVRPRGRVLVCVLLVLVVVDGAREANDYRLLGTNSPWQVEPGGLAPYLARDGLVRKLVRDLASTPVSRPARVPPAATAEPNASGWVADAYHLADYDPTIERSLWQVQSRPAWEALMLQPWHAFTFACAAVGCTGTPHLPAPSTWKPSSEVRTLSYGVHGIVYQVQLATPTLMVENELAVRGWRADTSRVRAVDAGIPLRVWRLAPGTYRFTATFQEPGRSAQYAALFVALIAWLGCAAALRSAARRPPPAERTGVA